VNLCILSEDNALFHQLCEFKKGDFIDYKKIPHIQCGCKILCTSNYSKRERKMGAEPHGSTPLGHARQPCHIGLGHMPSPPSPCHVLLLLLLTLGWATCLLHLIVLDWVCMSPPLPLHVGLGCTPPPPRDIEIYSKHLNFAALASRKQA